MWYKPKARATRPLGAAAIYYIEIHGASGVPNRLLALSAYFLSTFNQIKRVQKWEPLAKVGR